MNPHASARARDLLWHMLSAGIDRHSGSLNMMIQLASRPALSDYNPADEWYLFRQRGHDNIKVSVSPISLGSPSDLTHHRSSWNFAHWHQSSKPQLLMYGDGRDVNHEVLRWCVSLDTWGWQRQPMWPPNLGFSNIYSCDVAGFVLRFPIVEELFSELNRNLLNTCLAICGFEREDTAADANSLGLSKSISWP